MTEAGEAPTFGALAFVLGVTAAFSGCSVFFPVALAASLGTAATGLFGALATAGDLGAFDTDLGVDTGSILVVALLVEGVVFEFLEWPLNVAFSPILSLSLSLAPTESFFFSLSTPTDATMPLPLTWPLLLVAAPNLGSAFAAPSGLSTDGRDWLASFITGTFFGD